MFKWSISRDDKNTVQCKCLAPGVVTISSNLYIEYASNLLFIKHNITSRNKHAHFMQIYAVLQASVKAEQEVLSHCQQQAETSENLALK